MVPIPLSTDYNNLRGSITCPSPFQLNPFAEQTTCQYQALLTRWQTNLRYFSTLMKDQLTESEGIWHIWIQRHGEIFSCIDAISKANYQTLQEHGCSTSQHSTLREWSTSFDTIIESDPFLKPDWTTNVRVRRMMQISRLVWCWYHGNYYFICREFQPLYFFFPSTWREQ